MHACNRYAIGHETHARLTYATLYRSQTDRVTHLSNEWCTRFHFASFRFVFLVDITVIPEVHHKMTILNQINRYFSWRANFRTRRSFFREVGAILGPISWSAIFNHLCVYLSMFSRFLLQRSRRYGQVFFKSAEWRRSRSSCRNPRATSRHSQKRSTYPLRNIQTWVTHTSCCANDKLGVLLSDYFHFNENSRIHTIRESSWRNFFEESKREIWIFQNIISIIGYIYVCYINI